MGNWKNSYHLLDGDDALIGLENETVVKTQRGLGFNSHHDDPHVVPEEGNDDSGTGPAPAEPAPVEAPSAPAEPAPSPAPSEPAPVNEGTNQTGSSGTTGETTPPSNSGSGSSNSGNGSSYYDDYDDYDDYDSGYNNDDDDNYSGNGNSSNTDNNGSAEVSQSPTPNSNNIGKTKEGPPSVVSQRERRKAALLSRLDIEDFIKFEPKGMKGDIIRKYNHMKNYSSPIVAIDERGNYIEKNDFNVDGMDISIKREHDGYGNEFDSVRTIEIVKLANGQVVKSNIQDMVGANAASKAFADERGGMTLPDGKYYFTAEDLTEQADGTYNSIKFANTLRLQTKDSNIPKNIRDDINSKYFLFHATEYKEGFIPEDGGNRIWINPWSAGCISSITGGQSTHDDFMNMLTGITPENISVTITSKRHVNI